MAEQGMKQYRMGEPLPEGVDWFGFNERTGELYEPGDGLGAVWMTGVRTPKGLKPIKHGEWIKTLGDGTHRVSQSGPTEMGRCDFAEGDAPKMVAYLDGNEWHLTIDYGDEPVVELRWGKDWPEIVDADFLKAKGFEIADG